MLLLVTLLAACDSATPTLPPTPPPVGDSVRIGLVFDVAGSNAAQGVEQKAAAQLAVDEINAAGLEPHLVPVFEAGDGSEQTAMNAFQSLVTIELALVIIGPTSSGEAHVAHPVVEKAAVPVVAVSNTAGGITDAGDYVFRVSMPEFAVIPMTVAVAKDKLKVSQVCLCTPRITLSAVQRQMFSVPN